MKADVCSLNSEMFNNYINGEEINKDEKDENKMNEHEKNEKKINTNEKKKKS